MIHSSGSIGGKKKTKGDIDSLEASTGRKNIGSDVTNACTSLRHRKCSFANARRTVSNKKNEIIDAPYEF